MTRILARLNKGGGDETEWIYICWEKYIKGKSINGLPIHAKSVHYGVFRKKFFISYVHISYVNSFASIDTSV